MNGWHCESCRITLFRSWLGFLIAVECLAAVGCGGDKVERQHLRGSVTFQGKPVSSGQVRFSPVNRQGLGGATGGARIVNGAYDTRSQYGLASPVGEVQVLVTPDPNVSPGAKPLFPPFVTALTVASEKEAFDIQIP